MTTNFDCLLVNGDSYTAPHVGIIPYVEHLGMHYDVPVHNYAFAGTNNDRITRTTVEYLNKHLRDGHRPLVLIGWSYIRRIEVWCYQQVTKSVRIPDRSGDMHDPMFCTLDEILNAGCATADQKAMIPEDLHIHKKLTDFYTQVYLLAQFLENLQVPYYFFSAGRNTDCPVECFPYINSLSMVRWCKHNARIYRMHEFCVPDWAKDNDSQSSPKTGHLSNSGHAKFAKVIRNLIDESLKIT